jgi:hypothetical protein
LDEPGMINGVADIENISLDKLLKKGYLKIAFLR